MFDLRFFLKTSTVLVLLIVQPCFCDSVKSAEFQIEENVLRVLQPDDIKGDYTAAMANVGRPLYGGSMMGRTVYVEQNKQACHPFEGKYSGNWTQNGIPVIVLAQEGGCLWATKMWNVQKAGADAFLAINYQYKKDKLQTIQGSPYGPQYYDNITIPAAMISYELGEKIISQMFAKRQEVLVEFDWKDSMPNPDDRVEWEIWYASSTGCGSHCESFRTFLNDMKPVADKLEEAGDVSFQPHVMFTKCTGGYWCKLYCIKHGRYCSLRSVARPYIQLGIYKKVAWQNLRHLCVIDLLRASGVKGWSKWWEFVTFFENNCQMSANNFTDTCANNAVKEIGLTVKDVDKCMGDMDTDEEMHIVEAEIGKQNDVWASGKGKVVIFPTIVVNTEQYRGILEVEPVMRSICAGYKEGTEPDICLSGSLNVDDCGFGSHHDCWTKDELSACVDTFRGYKCKCPKGWKGDGKQCEDVDECADDTSGCEHKCVNTEGGYHCTCQPGFKLFGGRNAPGICLPQNPCIYNNGGCDDICVSTAPGRSTCKCRSGLQLQSDGFTCKDVDECELGQHKCHHVCVNLDPREMSNQTAVLRSYYGYFCSCEEGFMIDPSNSSNCIPAETIIIGTDIDKEIRKHIRLGVGPIFLITSLSVFIVIVIAIAIYKLWIRTKIQKEVRDILSLYVPLSMDKPVDEEKALNLKEKQQLLVKEIEE